MRPTLPRRPALAALLIVALAAALTSGAALADGPRAGAAWPQLKRDGARTGLSAVNGPATLAQKWASNADNPIAGGPVIGDDGTIYVTTDGPRVVAFRPDGTRRWSFTPTPPEGNTITGKPTFPVINSKGQIVFGTADGYIIGVNGDGGQAWRFDTVGAPYGGDEIQVINAPLGAAANYGRILVPTAAGNVYELEEGTFAGVRRAEGSIRAGAAVTPDGTVVWATTEKTVYGGLSAGGDRWKITVDGAVLATPAVSKDNVIYVPTEAGSLYAIRSDGTQRWNVKPSGRALRGSPALGPDGTIYVGSDDGRLYAINPDTGATKWSYATGGGITSAAAVGLDGTVYVGSTDNKVYVLSATGALQSSLSTGGAIDGPSPAIGLDGTRYIGSRDGKLYAYTSAGPAAPAATTPTPTAALAAPPPPTATPVPAIPTGRVDPAADGVYFFETGHNLRGPFLDYFNANGGLAQYGYPRTEQITLSDGRIVQWFQRARLEYTPSNPALGIQLGLLGDEILIGMGALPR